MQDEKMRVYDKIFKLAQRFLAFLPTLKIQQFKMVKFVNMLRVRDDLGESIIDFTQDYHARVALPNEFEPSFNFTGVVHEHF